MVLALFEDRKPYYGSRTYSEKTAAEIDEEVNRLLKEAYERCEAILKENRNQLDAVAGYLLEHEKIGGEEFKKLMDRVPQPA